MKFRLRIDAVDEFLDISFIVLTFYQFSRF